jgi:GrpB-like predicted nucleotidyltransferase (UPF0157 family)
MQVSVRVVRLYMAARRRSVTSVQGDGGSNGVDIMRPEDPSVDEAAGTSTREDQIRAATIGDPWRADGPIFLAAYDPEWPALYEREAARVRAILGDHVRLLEHAGSTSVPGLSAKPVIDMVLAVSDSADERAYVPPLEAEGYVLRIREPKWFEHRLFKGPDTNINLHTFSEGCLEIDRMLAFRDRLRTRDDERIRYEETKRELASRQWTFVQYYADAKGEVVEGIIERALAGRDEARPR